MSFIHQMILQQCKDQIEEKLGCEIETRQLPPGQPRLLYVKGTDPIAEPNIEIVTTITPNQ